MSPYLLNFIANITNQIQELRITLLIRNEFLDELKAYTTHIESCLSQIEKNTELQKKIRLRQEVEANAKSTIEQIFARCKSFATDRKAQSAPRDPEEKWIELQQSFPNQPQQETANDNNQEIVLKVQALLQIHLQPLKDKIQTLSLASNDDVAKLKAKSLQDLVDELSQLNKEDLQPKQVRQDITEAFNKAENNPVLAIERHWLTNVAYALLNALTAISGFGLAYRGLFCDSWFFHHKSASQALVEQTKQTFAITLQ